jgi:hypothetical protein
MSADGTGTKTVRCRFPPLKCQSFGVPIMQDVLLWFIGLPVPDIILPNVFDVI